MRKKLFLIFLFLSSFLAAQTPENNKNDEEKTRLIYGFDFDFYADNLENSQAFLPTRTLMAARIRPELGLGFYNQKIRLGSYLITNMGEKFFRSKNPRLGLTLYYDFRAPPMAGFFGIFPRKNALLTPGRFFYRDDFLFFSPLVNGSLLRYENEGLLGEFMLDWFGGDAEKRSDEFMIQLALKKDLFGHSIFTVSQAEKRLFFTGLSFQLFHTKNAELLNPFSSNLDVFLLDRAYWQVYLGADFGGFVPVVDELSFSASWLGGVDRKRFESRGPGPLKIAQGAELGARIMLAGFGLENSLYLGQAQYKYFKEYGEKIYWGSPFYGSRIYERAELFYEVKNYYLRARFSLIAQLTKRTFAHSQMFSISIDTQHLPRLGW